MFSIQMTPASVWELQSGKKVRISKELNKHASTINLGGSVNDTVPVGLKKLGSFENLLTSDVNQGILVTRLKKLDDVLLANGYLCVADNGEIWGQGGLYWDGVIRTYASTIPKVSATPSLDTDILELCLDTAQPDMNVISESQIKVAIYGLVTEADYVCVRGPNTMAFMNLPVTVPQVAFDNSYLEGVPEDYRDDFRAAIEAALAHFPNDLKDVVVVGHDTFGFWSGQRPNMSYESYKEAQPQRSPDIFYNYISEYDLAGHPTNALVVPYKNTSLNDIFPYEQGSLYEVHRTNLNRKFSVSTGIPVAFGKVNATPILSRMYPLLVGLDRDAQRNVMYDLSFGLPNDPAFELGFEEEKVKAKGFAATSGTSITITSFLNRLPGGTMWWSAYYQAGKQGSQAVNTAMRAKILSL